jgi:tetratricopeptide (TPR) repeat protein
VKQKPSAAASSNVQSVQKPGSRPVTSAAELAVPQDARKAFDKGLAAWQKKEYDKAAAEFEKAVALYPSYDTAYNNLGVMYAHLKQPEKALAAFEHSVQLNDKNADADRNLARMCMRQQNFARAEDLLKKSLSVQPLDASSLTMLSVAEIENGEVDASLRDARKVHELPHEGYALSHYVAGQDLERKQQVQDAIAEYMVYLRESPNGPEVVQVKSALDRLNAENSAAQSKAQ